MQNRFSERWLMLRRYWSNSPKMQAHIQNAERLQLLAYKQAYPGTSDPPQEVYQGWFWDRYARRKMATLSA